MTFSYQKDLSGMLLTCVPKNTYENTFFDKIPRYKDVGYVTDSGMVEISLNK